MAFKKNTAVTGFAYGLVDKTSGAAVTSGTPTIYYTLDGGTQGTVAGASTHEGNGQWSVNLTAAEMNGDIVGLQVTHTSCAPQHFTIATVTKLVSELNDLATTDTIANVTTVASTTTIGATGLAAIWHHLTSSITTAGSIGKLIADKLALLTGSSTITTTLLTDGGTLEIVQGHTFTYTVSVPVATHGDLTGYTGHLGYTKVTANSGSATLEVTASVTDPNTSTQSFVFTLSSAQTTALALDTAVSHPYINNTPAYTWTASASDGGSNCPVFMSGLASVVASDTTC